MAGPSKATRYYPPQDDVEGPSGPTGCEVWELVNRHVYWSLLDARGELIPRDDPEPKQGFIGFGIYS